MKEIPSKAFGPTDGVADTKTTVGSAESISTSNIVGAFFAGDNVVAAKASSAILHFEAEGVAGPNEYAVSFGGNTLGDGARAGVNFLPLNIKLAKPTSKITISVTSSEAIKDIIVSLLYA